MTKIIINPSHLEAVSLAMSSEQTRYYLCGVCIESYENGTHGLITTDGHRLASIGADMKSSPKESFILASADVDKALGMAKAEMKIAHKSVKELVKIAIDHDGEGLEVSIILLGKGDEPVKKCGSFTTKPIDGTFPDWRRVVPTFTGENHGAIMAFNAGYIADFGKMAKILGSKDQQITMKNTGANSPVIIEMSREPSFLGVLMPMRA